MIRKSKFHPNYQLLSPQPEPLFINYLFSETMRELPVLLSDQSEQRVRSGDGYRLAGRGTS